MSKHTIVVQLDADIARWLRRFLASEQHGYESISEFAQVAIQNQLTVEADLARTREATGRITTPSDLARRAESALYGVDAVSGVLAVSDLLKRPPSRSPIGLLGLSYRVGEALSPFTNRLSPIKVACRAMANLAGSEGWPEVGVFQRQASLAARALGQRLRDGDGSGKRRWVGYPIGEDLNKSVARFASSFTIAVRDDRLSGPMPVLGLASVHDGRVGLSRDGWRLAAAPSPLIDGGGGRTISPAEVQILRGCIVSAPLERRAVLEFLGLARSADGRQPEIDKQLALLRPHWSREMVVAHRAAMLGRLSELGLVQAQGRGLSAVIELLESGEEFIAQLQLEDSGR